jgi:hypothetical protein
MLVRELRTGRLIALPDRAAAAPVLGGYRIASPQPIAYGGLGAVPLGVAYTAAPGRVIYDGLGNPVGLPFLAALAPLAAKALAFLPAIGKAVTSLPALATTGASMLTQMAPAPPAQAMAPTAPSMPAMAPSPPPMPMAPAPMPMAPAPAPMPMPAEAPAPAPMPVAPAMAPVPPLPSAPPPPPAALAVREEVVIAPMRVQRPDGATMVVPVRMRRRRRRRRRGVRLVRMAPPPARPGGAPATLQGWYGLGGWRY